MGSHTTRISLRYIRAIINEKLLDEVYVPNSATVLIIATSARILAQSVRQAGLLPIVLDLYADEDTQQASFACYQLKNLKAPTVVDKLDKLSISIDYAVYGSGL